ncbi:hypothetical protein ACF07V_05650 [Streptomyces sp. NPDC015661]|uniref:hypothetical protein n=1 Tax=Streptomyces sp. NPDC015661 TaxID=3364961 RepID=UPI00370159C0
MRRAPHEPRRPRCGWASGRPFALVGSVVAYAHGIPVRLRRDTDFALLREDADAVMESLRERGVRIFEPPEDWLVKLRVGGEEIDLIFSLAGRPVTAELLDRAHTLPVDSVHMPVLAPADLMTWRLLALAEHQCDFGPLLPMARGCASGSSGSGCARPWWELPWVRPSCGCSTGWTSCLDSPAPDRASVLGLMPGVVRASP